ncbi:4-hydroxy-3-methylbut-2-enyl diphosphate reductase [Bacteroidales bacterium AH-315-I05]|nr:4-hydroxy-3-methylbut-2-enyl diphosphate reductase [Bacteroidales bacterium AH-315-I05]
MKKFEIPIYYRSSFISQIKELRKVSDPRKKDFSPTTLDFGPVKFHIARHFGFCYGVENAIEISYKALEENPGRRIFLLSQMIHNPEVNGDLERKGIRFVMDTEGNQFIDWEELTPDDIVIVPAFGTTLEIEERLSKMGIEIQRYNTTCPFVEKVWKMSEKLGSKNYSVVIHGKHKHEETRATFSHSKENAASIIIKDINEAKILGEIILGKRKKKEFYKIFENRHSVGFDVEKDLDKIGVVNQTTMLASETQKIADHLKKVMIEKFGLENYKEHFADTRDTLCYATNDNQQATYGLLEKNADFAIVVGGYNSSNTSHIVELCEAKLPTYYISSACKIESQTKINHFDFHSKENRLTEDFIPAKNLVEIILTSGASCPDTLVDEVLGKLLSCFDETRSKEEVLERIQNLEFRI